MKQLLVLILIPKAPRPLYSGRLDRLAKQIDGLKWYPIGLFRPELARRLDNWIQAHHSNRVLAEYLPCPVYGITESHRPQSVYLAVISYLFKDETQPEIRRQIVGIFPELSQAEATLMQIANCPAGQHGTDYLYRLLPGTKVFQWRSYLSQLVSGEIYRQTIQGTEQLNQLTTHSILCPTSQLVKQLPFVSHENLDDYLPSQTSACRPKVNLLDL